MEHLKITISFVLPILPFPPGLVTENESVLHCPKLLADPAAAAVPGPSVTVVIVTGFARANVSKSSLMGKTI